MSEGIAISLFLLSYLLFVIALGCWAEGHKKKFIPNNDLEEENKKMSEKQFESCNLKEATYVEINGKMYKIGSYEVRAFWDSTYSEIVGINIVLDQHDERTIRHDLSPILGIKTFKEKKREPIVFEGEAIYQYGYLVINVPYGAAGRTYRCIEIIKES